MSEWTLDEPVTEPVYDRADPQSGRALVDFHLCELGLGEIRWVRVADDGQSYCRHVVPQGLGVCRAYVLTEAAWPEGAELCVTVGWTPDSALWRDDRTGRVPAGAEEHWRTRIAATVQALESLGYTVEPSRFRRSPHHHFCAELLVYRMPDGTPPKRPPAETAWALSEPVPPNYRRHQWYPEQSPETLVEDVLREAGLYSYRGDWDRPGARIGVRSITQTVWPPEADRCTQVIWWPAGDFVRDPVTGLLPAGAEDHWRECLARLHQVLADAGLLLRSRARPWHPDTDKEADFLVYRVATSTPDSE